MFSSAVWECVHSGLCTIECWTFNLLCLAMCRAAFVQERLLGLEAVLWEAKAFSCHEVVIVVAV